MKNSVNKGILSLFFIAAIAAADIACWYEILRVPTAGRNEIFPSIHFLDVGQGDAELVLFPEGTVVLTDAGPSGPAVLGAIDPIFGLRGGSIDLIVISQPSLDHFGGIPDILDHYRVGAIVYNGRDASPGVSAWPALLEKISAKKIPLITLGEGDRLHVGSSGEIDILSPDREFAENQKIADTGIVQLVKAGSLRALFAADMGSEMENILIARYGAFMKADIIKIANNGSKNSSGGTFLTLVSPRMAVIEVGAKNSYHEPASETLARIISSTSASIFRTDEDGTVTVFRGSNGALSARSTR